MSDAMAANGWLNVNRANWDERVAIHVKSSFYDVPGFLAGRSTLRKLEIAELGNVKGKKLMHLQCHFGLDTLSWAREGADVTGVDFSANAIEAARSIATQAGLRAHFECSDVYSISSKFNESFDIVYTGLGAICWLPDIKGWAKVVSNLLSPDGELYLHEFHPFEWIFDELEARAKYDYFTSTTGLKIDLPGSYADPSAETLHDATVQWNHGIGSVVTALVEAGLDICSLIEHDSSVVQRWPFMVKQDGCWRMPPDQSNLPLLYTLRAKKPRF